MSVIGIDHSINGPALSFENAILYVTSNEKMCLNFSKNGILFKGYLNPLTTKNTDLERFFMSSKLLTGDWIDKIEPGTAAFEGYAFAGNGLTRIAESTCCTKYRLHERGWNIVSIAPGTIKKYATGKGNSGKDKMADAWKAKFGWYVHDQFGLKSPDQSPASDIVDSWFTRETFLKGKK